MKSSPPPIRSLMAWATACALLALLFGGELLTPGRSLFRWDTLLYTWPVIQEAREQGLSGRWPFWSDSVCCGTPLLANINAGVLYPLRALTWCLPLRSGLHLFVLVHLALSLVGMFLLLRRGLRLSSAAACVGALAYATCGYARGMWDTYNLVALPWIPLGLTALLAAGRAIGAPRRACRYALGAALCWWLMLLGGDFQAACLWPPAALLLCALHPQRRRLIPLLALALLVGGLLAAPQWVPTLHATQESYRAGGMPWAEAVERSVHPVRFLELLVPHLFGTRGAWLGLALAAPQADSAVPWSASLHIGRLAFGLAVLAFACRRARIGVRWGAAVAVVGALLSLGGFLPGFRYWLALPVLGGFRYPEKYLLWMSIGLAVLAAYGANALLAQCRRRGRAVALRNTRAWLAMLVAGTGLATWALFQLALPAAQAWPWARLLWAVLALTVAATLIVAARARHRSSKSLALTLVALIALDCASAWFLERPTTSRFDPLIAPLAAEAIRGSPVPDGRVLHDPAAVAAPSEQDLTALTLDERRVLLSRALLEFNSPVLWGLRTAGGFSPLESFQMHAYRTRAAAPPAGAAPDAALLLAYCQDTAVSWLLTTAARADALRALGLNAHTASAWGPGGALTLLYLPDAREATCEPAAPAAPRDARVHRFRPGHFRVDVSAGSPTTLTMRETWSAGWTAQDARGQSLVITQTAQGLMQVPLAADTTQVRFRYVPVGWHTGLWLGLAGLVLALLVGAPLAATTYRQEVRASAAPTGVSVSARARPLIPAVCCILLAVALGLGARTHWACTFDEGFHLARGLAALRTGDTRMNYFHPPLQNLLGAGFAELAYGPRLSIPTRDPSWAQANIWTFAGALAEANRGIFPELIRAARNGSTLLLALLIGICVWWAHRWRGTLAAWLTGLGLALNPALLAHGNLVTTDMGITTFVVAGTALLWWAVQSPASPALWGATLAFALGAATKYSGVIWLVVYLVLAVPLLAWTRRSWRPLFQIPFGLLVLVALLLNLYGLDPQVVRGEPGHWLTGASFPAGRYVEGLLGQEQHSLTGHRAYFHGTQLMRASWWYMPVALALKSPLLWVVAALVGTVALARRWRWQQLVAWCPFLVFLFLLVFVNRLAIGVRHALPVVVFGVVVGAVWAAGLPRGRWRTGVAGALVVASLSAAASYPHFISYYPAWAGGVRDGHRWMVDSNYDWGQDLEVLESRWAELTAANAGQPPHLMYFGFIDPVAIYGMPVSDPSLCGFMGRTRHWQAGPAAHAAWVASLANVSNATVASISALRVEPYGADFSGLRVEPAAEPIGNSLHRCTPIGGASRTSPKTTE